MFGHHYAAAVALPCTTARSAASTDSPLVNQGSSLLKGAEMLHQKLPTVAACMRNVFFCKPLRRLRVHSHHSRAYLKLLRYLLSRINLFGFTVHVRDASTAILAELRTFGYLPVVWCRYPMRVPGVARIPFCSKIQPEQCVYGGQTDVTALWPEFST